MSARRRRGTEHPEHEQAHVVDSGVKCLNIKDFAQHKFGVLWMLVSVLLSGRNEPTDVSYIVTNPYVSVLAWGWKRGKIWVLMSRAVKMAAGRMWDAVEGGISDGKEPEQSARKELYDEAGLRVDPSRLCFVGNFFQQSDRQLEEQPFAGAQPVPKRSRAFLAEVKADQIGEDTSDDQRLDDEEDIQPVWMELEDAIAEVEASALGENSEGDLGASPVLLLLLYRLWRMQQQGKRRPSEK